MDTYVAKGMNVSCCTIDGESFILDHDTMTLLKLDEVASFIWDHIDGTKTIEQISGICCRFFTGDSHTIQSNVLEFVFELVDRNVAVLSNIPFKKEMTSDC